MYELCCLAGFPDCCASGIIFMVFVKKHKRTTAACAWLACTICQCFTLFMWCVYAKVRSELCAWDACAVYS